MMPFASLPHIVRVFFTAASIAIVVIGSVVVCYAFLLKKWEFFISGILVFLIGYYSTQTCFEIDKSIDSGSFTPLIEDLGNIPYFASAFMLFIALISSVYILVYLFFKRRNMLAHTSVKEALNSLPAGLCYYYENGRIVLANTKMIDLCQRITGKALLNGNELFAALEDKRIFVFSDQSVYYFKRNSFEYARNPIVELVAYDVTDLYRKNLELKENNEKLKKLNDEMDEYNRSMFDSIREREILDTKISIHDETNRLLLSTRNAITGNVSDEEKLSLLKTWQKNVLLLCKEAETDEDDVFNDLYAIASGLGLTLTVTGTLNTSDNDILKIFTLSAGEALVNAGKHGKAKNVQAVIEENDAGYRFTFENDGLIPDKEITPEGGLKNLEPILSERNGEISFSYDPRFKMIVTVSK